MNELVAYKQIHKGSKKTHLKEIAKESGVALDEMVFFDDQSGNIRDVSSIGVLSIRTPDGIEASHWEQCLNKYNESKSA